MTTSTVPGRLSVWAPEGACVDQPALPWTADAWTVDRASREAMRQVCEACPVLAECAAYADTAAVTAGFWAGLDRDQLADEQPSLPVARLRVRRNTRLGKPVQLPLFDLPSAG